MTTAQLPTTIRGTCIDLVFGNIDAKCVGMLRMSLAVYQRDHKAALIKLSLTPNWPKREYNDITAGEHANWTVGFEVVEKPNSDGDHAETENADIKRNVTYTGPETRYKRIYPVEATLIPTTITETTMTGSE